MDELTKPNERWNFWKEFQSISNHGGDRQNFKACPEALLFFFLFLFCKN